MKTKLAALAIPLTLAFVLKASSVHADSAPPATNGINVVVSGFRNSNGQLGCRLFSGPDGYPKKNSKARTLWIPIRANTARCFFDGVAAGTYSVTVFHDENSNKKFDYNWVGYPLEGYGFSNNARAQFRAPSWDETSFSYDGARAKEIPITMIYR